MEFVAGYTKTVTLSGPRDAQQLDRRLQAIRQRARKLERSMKKATNPLRKAELEAAMKEEIDVWQSERDAIAEEKRTRLRERFHQARLAGHQHLAWRVARTHLAGKGGGVRTSTTTCLDRSAWEEHFARVYRSGQGEDLSTIDIGSAVHAALDTPIQPIDVQRALEKKKNLRAPGPDGFRVDFLRLVRYDDVVCSAIANLFNLILNGGPVPETWGSAFLFVLYKGKGDRSDPNSYRGITLKSQFLKLLESVICQRLMVWIDMKGLLPIEQLAYRSGLSGTDHLYILNILKEDAMLTGKKLCAGLIDLRKAFPSVNRRKLILDLVNVGVSARTVALLRKLYRCDTFCLLLDGEPGHVVFCVVTGVHEGSCLSPTLFIFFIRDLPSRLTALSLNCPVIGGKVISCMFFADDLTVLAYSVPDAQALVDESVIYFEEKGLTPNPEKCEFLVFGSRTGGPNARWNVLGVHREQQRSARYLGLLFQADGKWDLQLQLALSKSRSALGRCKIIMRTIGTGSITLALSFFDSIVASVYRFGLGIWGVSVAKIAAIDRLFVDYICWLFRFPRTTGVNVILSSFARRCSKCDSLFLAVVQIARAQGTRNSTWEDAVGDLRAGRLTSTWFAIVRSEIEKRSMTREVFEHGSDFVSQRKVHGVHFSQYCFAYHTNAPTGRTSDLFRRGRPFGMFPFLFQVSTYESRFLFSFICSVWRYIDRGACRDFPQYCAACDKENTGFHLLFECVHLSSRRQIFFQRTGGLVFCFDVLFVNSRNISREVVRTGREVFDYVRVQCQS